MSKELLDFVKKNQIKTRTSKKWNFFLLHTLKKDKQ